MSNSATDSMGKLDILIQKYAPIDLATGDYVKDAMTIDLRNIHHYAFSILCELNNLERRCDAMARDVMALKDLNDAAKRVMEIYKNIMIKHDQ